MLGKTHIQMLAGLAFMGSGGFFLFGLMMLLTWPMPVPLPSLAGVEPGPVSSTHSFSRVGLTRVSFGVPVGWTASDRGITRGYARVDVATWKIAPGIAVETAEDRRAAAELDMRTEYARLTAAREVTLAGRPAVEIAGARRDSNRWTLVTYGFVDGIGVEVMCRTDGDKRFGGPLAHTRGEDWTHTLPACAAAVASIEVGK